MFNDVGSKIQPLNLRMMRQMYYCCATGAQHILSVIKLNVILPSAMAS